MGWGVGGLSPNSILENGVSSNIIWCLYSEANYQLLPWVHVVVFSPCRVDFSLWSGVWDVLTTFSKGEEGVVDRGVAWRGNVLMHNGHHMW